jgi:6-pyruvoyltetrahydropterin/6-carboxytetrahydropterin synthase
MDMIIQKKYHFYAAHRNKAGGEKCGRIHGHTYELKCFFEFNKINQGGITYLFSDIDKLVEPIIKEYCHWFLIYENDPLVSILELANEPIKKLPFETSAENMSVWLFNRIERETKLPIIKIELAETKSSNIIYEIKS